MQKYLEQCMLTLLINSVPNKKSISFYNSSSKTASALQARFYKCYSKVFFCLLPFFYSSSI